MTDRELIITGLNPVCEALRSGRTINKIYLARSKGSATIGLIIKLAKEKRVPVHRVDKVFLDRLAPGETHQGVVAQSVPYTYAKLEDLLDSIQGTEPLLVLLDEVTDPHNLGAVIRSAEAAGAHGVIIPNRRAAAIPPAVVKASAGAAEFMPVARVGNIVQTIELLKKKGLWVVGADPGAGQSVWEAPLTGALAIVIGGEDKGLGRLVREKCDLLIRFPMLGRVNSLNTSVAAALVLFDVVRRRSIAE